MTCSKDSSCGTYKQCKVAVIGAGAAGLAAAKELQSEGHTVKVFEQAGRIGGTWVLDDSTDSDVLGQDPRRRKVHSSMYKSLRSNLPRELMSFRDFPFQPEFMKGMSKDDRRFPHHSEVLAYLQVYAAHFNVTSVIQFNTEVISVSPDRTAAAAAASGGGNQQDDMASAPCKWKFVTAPCSICSTSEAKHAQQEDTYDAVMVCNGHYSVPRIPPVTGLDTFSGRCEHSHNYRAPHKYAGEKVLALGAHASGVDIAWEVADHAAEVHLSAATWRYSSNGDAPPPDHALGRHKNIHRCAWVQQACSDGAVVLQDGSRIEAVDVIVFCTGYHFSFPFLHEGLLDICHDYVHPMFQHLFTPQFGPSLSFIGLPLLVVPFLMSSLQSMYVAKLLSGAVAPPDDSEVLTWMEQHYTEAFEKGVQERHINKLSSSQWPYLNWFCDQMGIDRPPRWREALWSGILRVKMENADDGDGYRDLHDTAMDTFAEQARAWAETFCHIKE